MPAFKIGSGECNNYPLVEYICSFKKPVILSTGMNSIRSIKKSVKIIESNKIDYALMHTTNLYPTPYNLVRLNALDELKDYFPKAILGLSDHTPDNVTSIAAIAKGAKIIEKHFVDSKKRKRSRYIRINRQTTAKRFNNFIKKTFFFIAWEKRIG